MPGKPFRPLDPKVVVDPPSPNPIPVDPKPAPAPRRSDSREGDTPAPVPLPVQRSALPLDHSSPLADIRATPTQRPSSSPELASPGTVSRFAKTIFAWIAGLLGSTIGLSFLVFGLLSLPLLLVSTIYLTCCSCFGAFFGVVLLS